jgi:hypothetical protein
VVQVRVAVVVAGATTLPLFSRLFCFLAFPFHCSPNVRAPHSSCLFRRARRNPAFEGLEAYVRFYLPEPHHVVYAVLGSYAAIGLYFGLKRSAGKRAALAAAPPPGKPDYHSPLPQASGVPEFGTPAWEVYVVRGCGSGARAPRRPSSLAPPLHAFGPPALSRPLRAQEKNPAAFK